MPKLAPVLRIGFVLLGALMVVGAFAGVIFLGIGTNPPPLRIAVVTHDLPRGESLRPTDFRVVEQIIDPRLAQLYVQENELPTYLGAYIIDTLRKGDPLNKVKLALGKDDLAHQRYALVLDNPDEVIMTIPVNPDIIPARIASGDFVNILFAGGSEGGLSRLPDATLATVIPELPTDSTAPAAPQTLPPGHEIALPLADLMLEHIEVLDVNYQTATRSSYGNQATTNEVDAPVMGAIAAIVVKVPRSHQTLLAFGASVSKLRFAIASPKLDAAQVRPQMGMDWGKYVALYRWKEQQIAARGETVTQTLYPNAALAPAPTSMATTTSVAPAAIEITPLPPQ